MKILSWILVYCFIAVQCQAGMIIQKFTSSSSSCDEIDGGECTNTIDSDLTLGDYSSQSWRAAELIAPDSISICQIDIELKRVGTNSNTISLEIYSDDGGTPKGNLPDSSLAVSSTTYALSDLSTSYTAQSFEFDTSVEISSGTRYWIVIKVSGSSSSNYIAVGRNNSGSSDEEHIGTWNGSAWSDNDYSAVIGITVYGD